MTVAFWAQRPTHLRLLSSMSSLAARPARALLVKPPYAHQIVNGVKTVEIRGAATNLVGERICIAQSGSQLLVGEVTLDDCRLLAIRDEQGGLLNVDGSQDTLASLRHAHCIEDLESIPYKKIYGWFLTNNVGYPTPLPYEHPQGAQCWVRLAKHSAGGAKVKRRVKAKR